jgi:hypothetical protein
MIDGAGTAASFSNIDAITWAGQGRLFVIDGEAVIREIQVATAAVTTILGSSPGTVDGTGASVRFESANGLTADGAGSLYVGQRSTIRKVVLATQTVTTLAGAVQGSGSTDGVGTAARFNVPRGIAWDHQNSLFVADAVNSTLRKIDLTTGAVSTLAGTPGVSAAIDGTGAAAGFSQPMDLVADCTHVYVADIDGLIKRIRRVTAAGEVTTIATFMDDTVPAWPGGMTLALDGAGHLFAASVACNRPLIGAPPCKYRIIEIDLASGAQTTLATGTDGLGSMTVDGAGNLYVADPDDATIKKIVPSTGALTTFVGSSGMRGNTDGVGTAARFGDPLSVSWDGGDSLFVADPGYSTIRKISLSTQAVTTVVGVAGQLGVAPGPLPGGLNGSEGVVALSGGQLAITGGGEDVILLASGL